MRDKLSGCLQQLPSGKWVEDEGLPYYPCLRERIEHLLFRRHIYYCSKVCWICGKSR